MDPVHIHLLLSHVPVLGTLFAVPVLAYGLIRKSDEMKRLGFIILVFAALVTIPVYLTGEPTEHVAEKLTGVSEAIIDPHEDSAKTTMIFMMITGAISLIAFFFTKSTQSLTRWLFLLTLLLSIVTAGLMVRTANLGGQIRHTEIGADGGTPQTDGSKTEKPKKEKDGDDH